MPDLWLPGATRVPGNNGLKQGAGGGTNMCFHTLHTFEGIPADYSYSPDGIAAARYLNSQGSTSHFVLNIKTGAIVQLLPANVAARTLKAFVGPGSDVNRYGKVHLQTEVLANARRPFTLDLTEDGRRGLEKLVNFSRAWGVKDQWAWPSQPPPAYPGGSVRRRLPTQSGWAYHSGWPVNDHGDPGAISPVWAITGTDLKGFTVEHWTWVQSILVKTGDLVDPDGDPVDGDPGPLTTAALKRFQKRELLEPDGLPGPLTTAALKKAEKPAPTPTPTPEPTPDPGPTLAEKVAPYRVAGPDAYTTAIALAEWSPTGPGTVLLAVRGSVDYASAAAAAARAGATVLPLPAGGTVPTSIRDHLARTTPAVVIVGGPGAIPDTLAADAIRAAGHTL